MKKKKNSQVQKNGVGFPKRKAVGERNGSKGDSGKRPKARPKKGEWNLVPIGEEFFSNKDFENLVSFEELVDYDVVTKADGTKEIHSGTKESGDKTGRKRTAKEVDFTEGEPDKDVSVPNKRKAKKTKEARGGRLSAEKSSEDLEVINTSAGLVIVEEDNYVQMGNGKSTGKANGVKKKDDLVQKKAKQREKKNEKPKKTSKKQHSNATAPEVEVDVDVSNADDNEEMGDFENTEWVKLGVPDVVIKALREKQFNKPTTIQTLTLPAAILGKKDIVGAAETGSGKTLAFAIPIIDGILKQRKQGDEEGDGRLKALILTPTRELAVQIKNHIDAAAKYAKIKTVVIVGGLATQKQERLLQGRPDIVIATPGRLWELVQEGDEHLSTLNEIRYLAIDETDRMVERGHFQELEGILTAVNSNEACKEARQNFVFSATLSFTHEPPRRLKAMGNKKIKMQQPKKLSSKEKMKQIMEMVGVRPNPKIVDITTTKGTCETLTEMQLNCSLDHKDYYLYYFLLQHPGRTIVFCNSINCVRRLTNLFYLLECGEVLPLHSEMQQKLRLRNLERFTANDKGVLIATDIAARGLDIQNIEHVIHYQVPKTAESYIHRSGRTARAFKGGIAILFVEPSETTTVKNIFRSLGRDEMLPNFSVDGKIFRDIKATIEMAIKVEQFEHSVRKKLADHNWMEKAKKDMDLASSSDESDDGSGGSTSQKTSLLQAKKKLENYKTQLSQMVQANKKSR